MAKGRHIQSRYAAYNFSRHKCHVVELIVSETGVTRIEVKLPSYIQTIKGIYISSKIAGLQKLVGRINVFFNNGTNKSVELPVLNSKLIKHQSHPLPLNEEIYGNSLLQGYFLDMTGHDFPYTIKIYLHYI